MLLTRTEIKTKILTMLMTVFDVADYSISKQAPLDISKNYHIINDLWLDDLDCVEYIMEINYLFKINIDDNLIPSEIYHTPMVYIDTLVIEIQNKLIEKLYI